MSLIKEALCHSDPEYKNILYPDKKSEHSKKIKPFTFSVALPPDALRKKERFLIDENIEVEDLVFHFPQSKSLFIFISSYDYQFIINLYNGLLQIQEFDFDKFNDIKISLERVSLLNEKNIKANEVVFKTNSPILIEDKTGKPLLPVDTALSVFTEHFNAIHTRILQDLRGGDDKKGQGLYKNMEFEPYILKKQVVKHTLKGFREKTGKPCMMLTTFAGSFKLKGDPRDLQMLYQSGIGLRTGQGFGMVEIM